MIGELIEDDNAGTVGSAALSVASLFFIAIMIIAFTANPIAIGTDVGERAPEIEGKAYDGVLGMSLISKVTSIAHGNKEMFRVNGWL